MKKNILLVSIAIILFGSCKNDVAESQCCKLSAWKNNDAVFSIDSIVSFVEKVCGSDTEFFVVPENRIAVFDMDGTIACEEPVSMETFCSYTMAFPYDTILDKKDRIITTTSGRKFTSVKLLSEIQDQIRNGDLMIDSDTLVETYSKMISRIYNKGIPVDTHLGRPLSKQFYKPMIELICYLKENDFTVYIVSGSAHQFICAATMNEPALEIDSSHIIGSTIDLKPVYLPSNGTSFLVGDTFAVGNVSKNKAINIHKQIGKTPIMAFGNTVNDFDMFAFTSSNKENITMCVLLNHDSDEYEAKYEPYDTNSFVKQNWTGSNDTGRWNSNKFDSILTSHNWHMMNMSEVFIKDSLFVSE